MADAEVLADRIAFARPITAPSAPCSPRSDTAAPPGSDLCTAVRQLTPGVRLRTCPDARPPAPTTEGQ